MVCDQSYVGKHSFFQCLNLLIALVAVCGKGLTDLGQDMLIFREQLIFFTITVIHEYVPSVIYIQITSTTVSFEFTKPIFGVAVLL